MSRTAKLSLALGVIVVFVLVGIGIGLLLTNIIERQVEGELFPLRLAEIDELEVDPEVWGVNFPRHFDRHQLTRTIYGRTPYAGTTDPPYDKLEANPFKRIAWAGMPFEVDYNLARGHYYAQIDQRNTKRATEFNQPGACLNCHSGEFTRLLAEMEWAEINRTPYNDFRDHISELGVSCADCHDPATMALRINRPALINALEAQGRDWRDASRQEMRSLVCAQCHVEYYFRGPEREVVFPWSRGMSVEAIEEHFDAYGFSDWTHGLTGAPMIKVQHPEYELFTTSVHYQRGVACADCHMPYVREGGVKISDHWIRSPLTNLTNACQNCHRIPEEQLRDIVLTIQTRTARLLADAEAALAAAIDAIVAAIEAGVPEEALTEARHLHRRAQLRWDFVVSENSMGFHSPQEAARITANAIDFARQAQLSAELARRDHQRHAQASTQP
jgi:nitrite reductase (cytochrome c-552)